jgi:hypothetical protein
MTGRAEGSFHSGDKGRGVYALPDCAPETGIYFSGCHLHLRQWCLRGWLVVPRVHPPRSLELLSHGLFTYLPHPKPLLSTAHRELPTGLKSSGALGCPVTGTDLVPNTGVLGYTSYLLP